MNYFITGTDTDAGKTYAICLWVQGLRRAGLDAVGMKPICCGPRTDVELLALASDDAVTPDEINPIWLRTPAAPYTACMIEERMIDLDSIQESVRQLRARFRAVMIEGVGGWLVPIRRDYFVADLAVDLDLPVVIVVRNRLGALNHTMLTLRDLRNRGLTCAGLILNNMETGISDVAQTTNRSVLEDVAEVPVLFEIERDQEKLELAIA